jgi:hypothetical protein
MAPLHAQTWDGGGADNNFLTPENWLGDVAPLSDLINTDLVFGGTLRLTPDFTSPFSADSLTFNNTAGSFILGGSTLSIGSGGIVNNSANTMTFNNVVDFSGVASSTIHAASGNLVFNNQILMSESLSLRGSGGVTIGTGGRLAVAEGQTLNVDTDFTISGGSLSSSSDSTYFYQDLTIDGGGSLSLNRNFYGYSADDVITVAGTGSNLHAGVAFIFGGNGTVNVTSGGSLTTGYGGVIYMANGVPGSSTVIVDGAGSLLSAGAIRIGGMTGSTGSLTFSNGSVGSLVDGVIQVEAGSQAGSSAILSVESGSVVTTERLEIRNNAEAVTSSVTITGNGSEFTLTGDGLSDRSYIGSSGEGANARLNIQNGGVFNTGTAAITLNPTGTINLDGGTFVQNGSLVRAGGAFNFTSGTYTSNVPFSVGTGGVLGAGNGTGDLTLGAGQTIVSNNTASIEAGRTLTLNGGTLTTGTSTTTLNASGALNIAGGTMNLNGTFLNDGGAVTFNSGTLNVNSGGTFNSGTDTITAGPGSVIAINGGTYNSEGNLTLDGGQLTREAFSNFNLSAGRTFTLQNGAIASIFNGYRNETGSTVTVSGGGSQFNVIGSGSGGMLRLEGGSILNALNGGSISAPFEVVLGYTAGSGTLLVDGAGSSLNTGGVSVGTSGKAGFLTFSDTATGTLNAIRLSNSSTPGSHGTLHISGGSSVTGSSLSLAAISALNNGTLTITGTNSALTLSGSTASTIGAASASAATLNIQNGGTFSTNTGLTTLNPTGTINLDGGTFIQNGTLNSSGGTLNFNSGTWTTNVLFRVGEGGDLGAGGGPGDVTLGAGKTLNTASTAIIFAGRTLAIGAGTYNVLDALTVNGTLTNGPSGSLNLANGSSMTVQNGGDVALDLNGSFNIGTGGAASVVVTGAGSTLTDFGSFIGNGSTLNVQNGGGYSSQGGPVMIGTSGAGTVTVSGAGSSFAGGSVGLGSGGILNIQNGGSFSGGVQTQIVSGGAINVNNANPSFGVLVHDGALNITGGNVGISGDVFQGSGSGTTISGSSTATFQGIYERTGGTFTTGAGSTAVFNGAARGPGGFDGTGTVEFHGSYSPGSSPGIVNIAGNAVFGSGNTLNMEIAGLTPGTQHDRINVGGNTTLGGAVNLAFTSNTFFPQIGNSFVIMDTGGSFTDTAIYSASGLRSGWQFSTDYNAVTGELTVNSLSKGVPLGAPVTNVTWNTNAVGNWSEAAKWSSNPHVPNNGNNNSVYNVVQNSGTVTVDQVVDIDAYTLSGFAVNTGGAGALNLSGLFTWSAGTINGTGALNANAGIDMSGIVGRGITDRTIHTAGTTTWASSGFGFSLHGNASIHNAGTWNVTGSQSMSGGVFNNMGQFNKSAGDPTVIATKFNNTATGVVNLSNATTLNLNGTGTNAHAGTFDIGAGSTLIFNIGSNSATDIHQLNEGVAFIGSGTLDNRGRLVANTDVEIAPTFVMKGTISGPGAITTTGSASWEGATLLGTNAATDIVNTNNTLNINPGGGLNGRTLNTSATTNWSTVGFSLGLSNGAVINNLASGVWNVTGSQSMSGGTFNNHGDFNKSAGDPTVIATTFNNTSTGAVTLSNATTLNLNGLGTNAHAGTFDIGAGSTLIFNIGGNSATDIHQLNEGVNFTGSGTLDVRGRMVANTDVVIAPTFVMKGIISGSGAITTTGIASWENATISGANAATDVLNTNNILNIITGGGLNGRTLNTGATTNWSTAGFSLGLSNGAVINNLASGAWNVTGNQSMSGGTFNNSGEFNKINGTDTTISSTFNNQAGGSVNVTNSRILQFTSGGGTHAGTFNIGSGSILRFASGTHVLNSGASFGGDGVLEITGATLTANAATGIATPVVLSGGAISGAGHVTLNGPVTWTGFGSMTGTNAATDATTIHGDLYLAGGFNTMNLTTRTLNTTGDVVWSGGGGWLLNVSTGAVINNSGTWDITNNGSLGAPAGGSFINTGEFNKTAGGTNNISPAFSNTGTVSVSSGTGSGLLFIGSVDQHIGTTLTGGTWKVSNGSTLTFNAGSNISTIGSAAKVTLDGTGSTFAKINTLNNNEGEFTVKNGRDFTTTGNLANSGTLRIEGTTTLAISSGGSGIYTQSAGATVLVGNALLGTSAININGGTLSGTGTVAGNATIGGTHAPGGSIGKQVFTHNLGYSSGSVFEWELGTSGTTRGTDYDAVNVSGVLDGGGAVFKVVLETGGFADAFWQSDREWTDIFMNGSETTALDYASIFSSFQYWEAGNDVANSIGNFGSFTIEGSVLRWQAIPEPSSALAGILLGLGLLRRRR